MFDDDLILELPDHIRQDMRRAMTGLWESNIFERQRLRELQRLADDVELNTSPEGIARHLTEYRNRLKILATLEGFAQKEK